MGLRNSNIWVYVSPDLKISSVALNLQSIQTGRNTSKLFHEIKKTEPDIQALLGALLNRLEFDAD
jgi:hypothetical protein